MQNDFPKWTAVAVSLVTYCGINIDWLIAVAERPSVFELTFHSLLISHIEADWERLLRLWVCLILEAMETEFVKRFARGFVVPADMKTFAMPLKHAMCASSWDGSAALK